MRIEAPKTSSLAIDGFERRLVEEVNGKIEIMAGLSGNGACALAERGQGTREHVIRPSNHRRQTVAQSKLKLDPGLFDFRNHSVCPRSTGFGAAQFNGDRLFAEDVLSCPCGGNAKRWMPTFARLNQDTVDSRILEDPVAL